MSEAKGMLKTCDRCGETVFLKAISDGISDGGYTRWNRFEDAPEGWDWRRETGTLCPKCNKEYENLLKRFMESSDMCATVKEDADDRLHAGGLY